MGRQIEVSDFGAAHSVKSLPKGPLGEGQSSLLRALISERFVLLQSRLFFLGNGKVEGFFA
jgi:hypothetical protein